MALLKDLTVYGVSRFISDVFADKVMINTDSTRYNLNVGGDSYVTGWSRAGSGFYCEGNGVHFTHQGSVGEIDMTSNNEFLWGSSGSSLYFNYRAVSRGTTVTDYIWNAGSSTTYAGHTAGYLNLFPGSRSNWGEGIRIHSASNGWTSLVLCGTDNTGDGGTSANSWSIHNNNGVFSISKNSSSYAGNCAIGNSGGTWYINNRLTINSSGQVAPVDNYYNAGMYGNYAATRLGHIWSIGTGYYMNANGLSPNTAYGMLYFHTNWSNNSAYNTANATKTALGTYAGGHQIGFFNNGVLGVSIGLEGNIWNKGNLLNKGYLYTTGIYGGCNSTFTTNYWSIDGSANAYGEFTFHNTVNFSVDTNYGGTARFGNDVKIYGNLEHHGTYDHYGELFQIAGDIDMGANNITNVDSIRGSGTIKMGNANFDDSLEVNGESRLYGRTTIRGTIDANQQSLFIGDITASGTVRTNGDLITHGIKPVDSSIYSIGNIYKSYKSLYVNNIFTDNNYIVKPAGGDYRTTTANVTGAICITLPANIGNTMVSMWIDVYNYVTNASFSVHVGGYTYSTTWANSPFAMVYGGNHRVRLGHNGTSFTIYIGEVATTWKYPQVSVRDVVLGYSPTFANWVKQWTISFVNSFSNVTWNSNGTNSHYAWTTKNQPGLKYLGVDWDCFFGDDGYPFYDDHDEELYGLTLFQNINESSGIQLNGDYINMWSPCDSGYSLRYWDEDNGNEVWNISSNGRFSGTCNNADKVDGVHISVLTESQWSSTTPAANTLYVIT